MLKFLSIILISLLPINAFAIEINSPAFKDGEKIPKNKDVNTTVVKTYQFL